MLDFSQMLLRFIVALLLGALIGLERELAGKEAGIRTSMLVAGGAALFSLVALEIPYLTNLAPEEVASGGFLHIIANIVVGIGFLGGGIIIKTQEHVHGLTTAAVIWVTAAIGILAGIGLMKLALISAAMIAGTLYVLRKLNVSEKVRSD